MMAVKHSTVTMKMARYFDLLCHLLVFDLDKRFPPFVGMFQKPDGGVVFYGLSKYIIFYLFWNVWIIQ